MRRRNPILGFALLTGLLILAIVIGLVFRAGREASDPASARAEMSRLLGQTSLNPEPAIPLEMVLGDMFGGSNPQNASAAAGDGNISSTDSHVDSPLPDTGKAVVEETRRVADELAQKFPDDPDSLEIAARMLVWLGDSEAATRAWQACLKLDKGYAYAYDGLGTLAAKQGQYDEAISLFQEALEASRAAGGMPDTRARLGQVLIDQGRLDEAIEVLQPDRQAPIPVQSLQLLGKAHLQARRYATAQRYYEAVISQIPDYPDAQFGLATALLRQGDRDSGARHMQRFQELRSGELSVRKSERSDYDDVEEMRQRLATMHENAGRLCHAHGDLAAAESHWQRARALDAKAVDCRQAIAWFCQQDGKTAGAIEALRELDAIDPDNPAYLLEVGRLEATLGRYTQAEEAFQGLCDRLSLCADSRASLAKLYLYTGQKTERVVPLAETAAQLEPTPENLLLLAAAYERHGQLKDAVATMQEVTRMVPSQTQYQQVCQELSKRLGEKNSP